jgi:hypothetical protein
MRRCKRPKALDSFAVLYGDVIACIAAGRMIICVLIRSRRPSFQKFTFVGPMPLIIGSDAVI